MLRDINTPALLSEKSDHHTLGCSDENNIEERLRDV
jgi:hypothetical protein